MPQFVKNRDPRQTVLIQMRMRAESTWVDVKIHNISKRGMLVRADHAPRTGSVVELRKGQTVVVGRVMWRLEQLFGIRTQDTIQPEALTGVAVAEGGASSSGSDRRQAARVPERVSPARAFDQSRYVAGAIQYVAAAIIGVSVAISIAYALYEILSAPIKVIAEHLG